jgi:hypothetical protein
VPSGRTSNLILDQYEQLWLAAGEQLLVLPRGAEALRPVLHGYAATNLGASPDGRLWLDTQQLVPVPPQHGGAILPRQPWLAQAEGQESGLFDRDGNYWSLGRPRRLPQQWHRQRAIQRAAAADRAGQQAGPAVASQQPDRQRAV